MGNSNNHGKIAKILAVLALLTACITLSAAVVDMISAFITGRSVLMSAGIIPIENSSPTAEPTPSSSASELQTSPNIQGDDEFYRATCSWDKDWELQADGSYLWVGIPPGTLGCANVGQAGELLQRLKSCENITLVVEVGGTPLGLDICSGEYRATTVISGQTCASGNPGIWPKVSGRLVVIKSTGFLVGTGR